jgi:hypothetical protein
MDLFLRRERASAWGGAGAVVDVAAGVETAGAAVEVPKRPPDAAGALLVAVEVAPKRLPAGAVVVGADAAAEVDVEAAGAEEDGAVVSAGF